MYIRVRGPTLPINIVIIIITFEIGYRKGVIPLERPTVPKAENTSKRSASKPKLFWNEKIKKEERETMPREIKNTRKALPTVSSGIFRDEKESPLFPFNLFII